MQMADAGLFVTGTDTGVGKTRVAVALLRALAGEGRHAVGMKPVAAGIAPGAAANADVDALRAAGNVVAPPADVNPFCYAPPIAPHVAAAEAGQPIRLETIVAAYERLAQRADVVVVEGAGGALVPLGGGADMLDIAAALRLPVLLVVGIRLGCLNHALLSELAIRGRGLRLAGWVANRVDPAMERADDSVRTLDALLGSPRIADLAWEGDAALPPGSLAWLGLLGVPAAEP
jgi:dethiobiotin synthetase